ncbi:MAG: hypothetical protein ACREIC_06895 [Limisphaerales bacterium]
METAQLKSLPITGTDRYRHDMWRKVASRRCAPGGWAERID